jgi:hypothetical protein
MKTGQLMGCPVVLVARGAESDLLQVRMSND